MRYTVFKFEQDADESSITYVDGLGFIAANNRMRYLRSLRRSSSFLCFLILLYFICDQILIRPFTYLGYYLGLDIQINASTGWITMSESTSLFIGLFAHFVSLLLPLALCSLFYRDRLFSMRIFTSAQRGVSLIAIPITLAFGLLGEMIGAMIGDLSEIFGFFLRSQQNYHTMSDAAIWYTLFGTLLVAVLSEILIHGMALTALRSYGDGFAVVCCAILSALMTSNAISAVSMFVFSLCAGYFAIRGGSLRPILIARILRELISFGFSVSTIWLTDSLTKVVQIVTCLLIVAAAFLAYIHFIRLDANAFRLVHPNDRITNKLKFANFCSTFFFFLLVFRLIAKLIETVELIG